jgi:hypothetical protein
MGLFDWLSEHEATIFRWVPEDDACTPCRAMALYDYAEAPTGPHPNCRCRAEPVDVVVHIVGTSTERHVTGTELRPITDVRRGTTTTIWEAHTTSTAVGTTRTDTRTDGSSTTSGGAVATPPVTLNVGITSSAEESRADGSSVTDTTGTTVTEIKSYPYDPAVGGDVQWVMAVYEVGEIITYTRWEGHVAGGTRDVSYVTHSSRPFSKMVTTTNVDAASLLTPGSTGGDEGDEDDESAADAGVGADWFED